MCEKWIFSGFVTKTAESHFAWFSSLLQTTWAALRKRANIHFHRLLDFAPTVFLFCSCILMRIIYTWLTKSVLACLYWWWYRLFSSEWNIRIKIHSKNTNTIGAKTRGLLEWIIALFLLPKNICSKLQNQAKCDSAAFTTTPLKLNFSHTFWLLQVAIIARRNCNCYMGHRALPD